MRRPRPDLTPGRAVGETARDRLLASLPVTEHRLTVTDVDTAVLHGGQGPPVVFVQGEFALVWFRVIPELVQTHRVIAPDLPGLGASALPDGHYDLDLALGWLGDLIHKICDAPPVLVGKGPAGALAARYAIDQGGRLAGLVLVDAQGLGRFRPPPSMALAYLTVLLRPSERSVERSLQGYCFTDLGRVRAELGQTWDWFSSYTLDYFRTPKVRTTMRRLMPQLGRAIPPADLARIDVPTTLIWGRDDLGMPLSVAADASARYGWPLHVIDGARDDPAIEQPTAFLTALREALNRS